MVERVALLGLGLFIPIVDGLDMLIRLYRRSKLRHKGEGIWPTSVRGVINASTQGSPRPKILPYKVLVSVFNIAGSFQEFRENMAIFGYHNVLVVDDASTDRTPELLRGEGIPYISNKVNMNKPASIYHALTTLSPDIETVAVIDPDARILNLNPREYHKELSDFDEVLSTFQQSGYEACSVRIVVHCGNLLEYLQNYEYKIAMGLARKSLSSFCPVSGAFAFFKRKELERVLKEHSVSIYGEDYETSLRILADGGRIYYDGRLAVMTNQRRSLWDLTKQRMGWDLSLIKIHFLDRDKLMSLTRNPFEIYQYIVYNTILLIFLHPLRVMSCILLGYSFLNMIDNITRLNIMPDNIFNNQLYFITFFIFYLIITYGFLFAVERRRLDRYYLKLPMFPFYVLYTNLVPRTLGFLNFFGLLILRKKLIEDGYKVNSNGKGQNGKNGLKER